MNVTYITERLFPVSVSKGTDQLSAQGLHSFMNKDCIHYQCNVLLESTKPFLQLATGEKKGDGRICVDKLVIKRIKSC